jgi:hypothetical protein
MTGTRSVEDGASTDPDAEALLSSPEPEFKAPPTEPSTRVPITVVPNWPSLIN